MVVDSKSQDPDVALLRMINNMSQCQWWREPNLFEADVNGSQEAGCSAARMWRAACSTLVAPHYERAWNRIVETAPPDHLWHTLRNCTAYQAGVWSSLVRKGVCDVTHPAGFRLAIILRHTPSDLVVKLLADLLCTHPQSQDLLDYILSLLTDDEAVGCGVCGGGAGAGAGGPQGREQAAGPGPGPGGGAPLRDRLLFGDCEMAVYAAEREEYDAHAKMIRLEFTKLSQDNAIELRIKILNELLRVPTMFSTPEFQTFEATARDNVEREITALRELLLTGRKE